MQHRRLESNGFTFDAITDGPVDGELVMLLHGFPETSRAWRHQIPALAAAGFRVLAPDQRGYSPGARPPEVDDYRSPHLVADVLGLADALGVDRFHLVGHDWGGAVAWQIGGRHADRLLSLAVLSTPHPIAIATAVLEDRGDQRDRSSYMVTFQAEGSEDRFLADGGALFERIYEAAGMPADESEPYRQQLGTPEALGAALNWYRAADRSLGDGLVQVPVPTLYVWSTGDKAFSREVADATGDHVEGPYRFEVLEGVSHWIPEHAPDELTRLLLEHLSAATSMS
jgi:pimeloyl-ACP methyl ester carboxylesterase